MNLDFDIFAMSYLFIWQVSLTLLCVSVVGRDISFPLAATSIRYETRFVWIDECSQPSIGYLLRCSRSDGGGTGYQTSNSVCE